jgi:hypothetical protein
MTRLLAILLLTLTSACRAESPAAAPETEKHLTTPDKVRDLFRRAKEAAGQVADIGKPRIVPKGKKPEVIIKGSSITFDRMALRLGGNIGEWRKVLGGVPRQFKEAPTIFTWDLLGIELVTDRNDRTRVAQMTLLMNREPPDPYEGAVTHRPDGRPVKPLPDFKPLDTFGIDADTQFWEIRQSVDPKRNLDCGLRDCSHPHGAFGENGGLFLRLDRGDEYGKVYELSISASQEYAKRGERETTTRP